MPRSFKIGQIYRSEKKGDLEIVNMDKWDMFLCLNGERFIKSRTAFSGYLTNYDFFLVE